MLHVPYEMVTRLRSHSRGLHENPYPVGIIEGSPTMIPDDPRAQEGPVNA